MTSWCHSAGVSRILGKAACTRLLGPIILFAQIPRPARTLEATLSGSCRHTQPNRQPGRRNRLERPPRVKMGTVVEREARGWKADPHVWHVNSDTNADEWMRTTDHVCVDLVGDNGDLVAVRNIKQSQQVFSRVVAPTRVARVGEDDRTCFVVAQRLEPLEVDHPILVAKQGVVTVFDAHAV